MKRYSRFVLAMLAVAVAASATACGNKGLIAKVNGEGIKKAEYDNEVARYKQQYPTMFDSQDAEFRFRQSLLTQMIDAVLLRQAAKKEGISVSDAEIDKQVENLKKGFKDQAAFEDALKKSGYTLDQFKQFTADQLISQRLIEKVAADVKVTDAEIKDNYDKNKARYSRQSYELLHTAHILFADSDQKTAIQVYDELAKGGDFAAAARKYSKDVASASKGGDLGFPTMPYSQEYQAAADKLDVGGISQPVKTPFGWEIIKLVERRTDKQKTFDDVKEQIRQILFQQRQAQAYQGYLTKLRSEAKIEIFDDSLKGAVGTSGSTPPAGK